VSQAGNQQKAGIKQSRLLCVYVLLGSLFDPEDEGDKLSVYFHRTTRCYREIQLFINTAVGTSNRK
jgi:hypothetical protein